MPGLGSRAEQGSDRRERKKKPELRHSRSGGRRRRARADCPDSTVIHSSDHHSSSSAAAGIFSSASGSAADRRSFGSDHDAILPQHSFSRLAGRESSGPAPDREKGASYPKCDTLTPSPNKNQHSKSKEPVDNKEEDETLDPTNHSFSLALRECQNQRLLRPESVSLQGRKLRRRRPASLDLNGGPGVDAAVLSPRFLMGGAGGIKRSSAASSRNRSGTLLSPGTPNYRHSGGTAGYQKGWSSERVPLPANCSRRYLGSGVLLPFNNGRTLPSKWEDAEKWICSPVSGDGAGRPSVAPSHHRRPKSKSGPLGAPVGIGGPYSSASPLVPCFDSGRVGSFTVGSPFLAGVLVADRGCCGGYSSTGSGGGGGGDVGRSSSANADPYIVRSASLHGWSDALIESSSSLPSSQGTVQDEKLDNTRAAAVIISPVVLRKDVATQMSPEGSTHSSPKKRPSFSPSTPSTQLIEELENNFSKMEVRDVQVDDCVTVTRWSKKHIVRGSDKRSTNIIEWKKKTSEAKTSACEIADKTNCMSRYKREEAKITAWENLQKAKAEAAMRKLEMKLEKKRSSTMVKIFNKLRSAQKKAQDMRSAATASQDHQVARTTKRSLYLCKTGQMSSLSGCFTCHAF